MVRSHRRGWRKKRSRFETAAALVLGRAQVRRAPVSSPTLPWMRGVLLFSLVAIVAGALWLALDDCFYVYEADVVGADRVSPNEVFRASGLAGLHSLWVHPSETESRILATIPSLESAEVHCGLTGECTIVVVEREPMVTWDEDGRLRWIDAEGVILPAEARLSEGLLVQGPLPRAEDGRLEERVRVGMSELWAFEADVAGPLWHVSGRGLVFTDARGWRVIVGQGTGMAERLKVFEWVAAELEARGLSPRFIDVRFPDAPYYSLTNDW